MTKIPITIAKEIKHRDSRGRFSFKSWLWYKWQMFLAWVRFCIKVSGATTLVMWLMVGSFLIGKGNEVAFASTGFSASISADKVDVLKNKVLDEMVACENPHHWLVWLDDTKSHSLTQKDKNSNGDLAFKISTVQRFSKQLHGTTLNDHDALLLALDPSQARDLAINSWVNIKGSINEWSCATDVMKTQIDDIRLMQ